MTKVKYSPTLYKLEFWTNHYVIVQVVSILNLNNKIFKSLNVIKRRKKLSINWLTRISFFQRKNKKFFNLFSSNAIWSHHIISDRLISKRFLRDLRRFLSVELLISGVILLRLPPNKVDISFLWNRLWSESNLAIISVNWSLLLLLEITSETNKPPNPHLQVSVIR